ALGGHHADRGPPAVHHPARRQHHRAVPRADHRAGHPPAATGKTGPLLPALHPAVPPGTDEKIQLTQPPRTGGKLPARGGFTCAFLFYENFYRLLAASLQRKEGLFVIFVIIPDVLAPFGEDGVAFGVELCVRGVVAAGVRGLPRAAGLRGPPVGGVVSGALGAGPCGEGYKNARRDGVGESGPAGP